MFPLFFFVLSVTDPQIRLGFTWQIHWGSIREPKMALWASAKWTVWVWWWGRLSWRWWLHRCQSHVMEWWCRGSAPKEIQRVRVQQQMKMMVWEWFAFHGISQAALYVYGTAGKSLSPPWCLTTPNQVCRFVWNTRNSQTLCVLPSNILTCWCQNARY